MTLQTILPHLLPMLAGCYFAAMTILAITVWVELRRLKRNIIITRRAVAEVAGLTMASHIRGNVSEISKMKEILAQLVKHEKYEEAEKLKASIANMERQTQEAIQKLNSIFGEDVCEVVVTNIDLS